MRDDGRTGDNAQSVGLVRSVSQSQEERADVNG